jgi:hypothetical protein
MGSTLLKRGFGLAVVAALAGCAQSERWTILCLELEGPGAEATARQIAQVLRRTPQIDARSIRVLPETDGAKANIYYGSYERRIDPRTGARSIPAAMERDMVLLKELADPDGLRYFLRARKVPFPSADVGRPEWDLRRADGVYTLQVAVYFNTDKMRQRKKAAAEKTRQLRARGLEAYYYHGPTRSLVTVGSFGEDALLDQVGQVRHIEIGGQRRQVAHHYAPDVVELQKHADCRYNLTNDDIWHDVDQRTGQRYTVRSMLVRIPTENLLP